MMFGNLRAGERFLLICTASDDSRNATGVLRRVKTKEEFEFPKRVVEFDGGFEDHSGSYWGILVLGMSTLNSVLELSGRKLEFRGYCHLDTLKIIMKYPWISGDGLTTVNPHPEGRRRKREAMSPQAAWLVCEYTRGVFIGTRPLDGEHNKVGALFRVVALP